MKICVFGADGRTGVEVVRYALSKGYTVTAFVYNEKAKQFLPDACKVVVGDIMNYADVNKALAGTDAVISVVGHIKGSDPLMQTKGVGNIVEAMKEQGVRRVLSLTGTGARVEGDTPSVSDRFLNALVKLVDPERINDGIKHVQVLQNSNLNWTIVRVLKLSKKDKPVTDYKLSTSGPAELVTSRKKVAKVLVDLVKDETYIKQLPVISG